MKSAKLVLLFFVIIGSNNLFVFSNDAQLKSVKYARQIELPFLNWLFGRPVRNTDMRDSKNNNTLPSKLGEQGGVDLERSNSTTNSSSTISSVNKGRRSRFDSTFRVDTKQPSLLQKQNTTAISIPVSVAEKTVVSNERSGRYYPGYYGFERPNYYGYRRRPNSRRRYKKTSRKSLDAETTKPIDHKEAKDLEASSSSQSQLLKRQGLISSITPQQQLYLQLQSLRQQQQLLALSALGVNTNGLGYANYDSRIRRRRRRPNRPTRDENEEDEEEEEDYSSDYNDDERNDEDVEFESNDNDTENYSSDDFDSEEFMVSPFSTGFMPQAAIGPFGG